ncbi:MAG: transposase [Pirellulales bacterium]
MGQAVGQTAEAGPDHPRPRPAPKTRPSAKQIVLTLFIICERLPMRLLGYCLMPNHFHLVLWPLGDGDLSHWMQWLLTAHVRRYHRHYHGSGHVWQGRFKAFPIEQDEHLLTVLRYVERNPLRAGLVERAKDWKRSSLRLFTPQPQVEWLHPGPVPRVAEVERLAESAANRIGTRPASAEHCARGTLAFIYGQEPLTADSAIRNPHSVRGANPLRAGENRLTIVPLVLYTDDHQRGARPRHFAL